MTAPTNLTVGVKVSGLATGNSITVSNGTSSQTLTADGVFTFSGTQASGSTYNVSILTPPASQPCASTYGTGVAYSGNVVAEIICGPQARGGFVSEPGILTTGRYDHTATLLANGKVLVTGGYISGGATPLITAELYDPATKGWTAAGSMSVTRGSHTATLLANGKVLVTGGQVGGVGIVATAELYDPGDQHLGGGSQHGSISPQTYRHAASQRQSFCDRGAR